MTGYPFEAFDQVQEPGSSTDILVEPRIAVGKNVESGASLVVQNTGDGVRVLFSEYRVGQRHFEGAAAQIRRVPLGPWVGAHHGGCQRFVFCRLEHGILIFKVNKWRDPRRSELFSSLNPDNSLDWSRSGIPTGESLTRGYEKDNEEQ